MEILGFVFWQSKFFYTGLTRHKVSLHFQLKNLFKKTTCRSSCTRKHLERVFMWERHSRSQRASVRKQEFADFSQKLFRKAERAFSKPTRSNHCRAHISIRSSPEERNASVWTKRIKHTSKMNVRRTCLENKRAASFCVSPSRRGEKKVNSRPRVATPKIRVYV